MKTSFKKEINPFEGLELAVTHDYEVLWNDVIEVNRVLYKFVSRMFNILDTKECGDQGNIDKGFIFATDVDKQGVIVSFTEVETKKMWVYKVVADTLEIIAYMDEKETLIHKCYIGELYLLNNGAYYRLLRKQHELVFKLWQTFDEFRKMVEWEDVDEKGVR